MRALALTVVIAALAGGCVSAAPAGPYDRSAVMRVITASTVQLRADRDGGGRRAASGVVVAADAARRRSWIVTARHFLDPGTRQKVSVSGVAGRARAAATVSAVSDEADLALVEVEGLVLSAVVLKDHAQLGDEVWVAAFPFGRRLTVVSGTVSQIASEDGDVSLEGPVRMVDAQASYGSSGGGIYDAATGRLLGIVEGYRTARLTLPTTPERTLDVPVPGETTVLAAPSIRRFLRIIGIHGL
ncbi:MAG: S1 family peptidase [Candidatus Rokuibacteriota bacterium]